MPEHLGAAQQCGEIRVLFNGKRVHAAHPNSPLDFAASVGHVEGLLTAFFAMTQPNPLLTADTLPRFAEIRAEHVEPAVDAILADYSAAIDALTDSQAPRDFANT